MKSVKAFVEIGQDGTFGVYMDENDLSYSVVGDGKSAQEAVNDFLKAYSEMKDYYTSHGEVFEEVNFEFEYDIKSFLLYYKPYLTRAGLERLTGINQRQLGHYLTGIRKPSHKTACRIVSGVSKFGNQLSYSIANI